MDDQPAAADRWQRSPDRVGRGRCRAARPVYATYPPRDALTTWSDRLRAAVEAALKTSPNAVTLLADREGKPIGKAAWNSAWQRWQKKLEEAGVEPFTPHDLKAKGVSDFEGDKQAASGHRTPGQVAVYDRKPRTVKPTR